MDLVNKITVLVLWVAIKLGYLGTAAFILATLLGATLPIAASGLYKIQAVQWSSTTTLEQISSFDPSLSLATKVLTIDFYPVPGLILYQNLSYPQWNYGKYALPEIALDNLTTPDNRSDKSAKYFLSVEVPALYGVANCTPIPTDNIKYEGTPPVDPM